MSLEGKSYGSRSADSAGRRADRIRRGMTYQRIARNRRGPLDPDLAREQAAYTARFNRAKT